MTHVQRTRVASTYIPWNSGSLSDIFRRGTVAGLKKFRDTSYPVVKPARILTWVHSHFIETDSAVKLFDLSEKEMKYYCHGTLLGCLRIPALETSARLNVRFCFQFVYFTLHLNRSKRTIV